MGNSAEWRLEEVPEDTYAEIVDKRLLCIYNTAKFNRLNKETVDRIWYLVVYKGESLRFAVVFGEKDKTLLCPFSAPFGYPESMKKDAGLEEYYTAYNLTRIFFQNKGIKSCEIYMPPTFYEHRVITAWTNVLYTNGFCTQYCDVNYSFCNIETLFAEYTSRLQKNARKNLAKAFAGGLEFEKCVSKELCHKAYGIIEANRREKNRPLRMKEEKVIRTLPIVNGEWYVVRMNDIIIAAALVYAVSKDVAQIVYWGDLPQYATLRPTNYISYKLLEQYVKKGYKYLDVGISTEEGQPNFGLCDFKESIGCTVYGKARLIKHIEERYI